MVDAPIRLWFWTITDKLTGKRKKTTWRMTEEDALARHGADAQKVAGTLEERRPLDHTGVLTDGFRPRDLQ